MFSNQSFLALHPEWVLRNEKTKTILYLMSNYESNYLILDSVSAVVISLLNGQRTVEELSNVIKYIFKLSSLQDSYFVLKRTVEKLNTSKEKISILDQPASWSTNYNPLDFIVSSDNYSPNRRLARPLALLVYFSSLCQTTCKYCYADLYNMRKLNHISIEKWLPILQEANNLNIRIIQLTGGDPLGRIDSIDFLIHLIKYKFLFLISTKCYVSEFDADRLVDSGFNDSINGVHRDFQISFDSCDSSIAKFLVGRSDFVDNAIKTIKNLTNAGIYPRVKSVLTPFNFNNIKESVDLLTDLGVKCFNFSLYSRSNYRHNDELFLTDEMKLKIVKVLRDITKNRTDITIEGDATQFTPKSNSSLDSKEKNWRNRASCSAGRTVLGVAPDGHAVLCEQMPLTRNNFVGDLTTQSILEVWNSPELLNFIYPSQEKFLDTACYECSDFQNCVVNLGYCFRDSLFAYNELYCPPPNCPHATPVEFRTT